ncbi:MAG: FAD-dependent thymidylate synthase [Candidatus Nanohaloarchaeota archaeon QJJ-9]|nr:FAD-dependent thymidylate synthase [Candidatus Nanohaloarchaeota archaeon QJJ-9]
MGDLLSNENIEVKVLDFPENPNDSDWGPFETAVYTGRTTYDQKGESPTEIKKTGPREHWNMKSSKEFYNFMASRGQSTPLTATNHGLQYKVPRVATLALCSSDYARFMQESQRYVDVDTMMSKLIDDEEVREMYEDMISLYNDMNQEETDVRKEDARYITPLATGAKHIHENGNLLSFANYFRLIESDYNDMPPAFELAVDKAYKELNELEPRYYDKEVIESFVYGEEGDKNRGHAVPNIFTESNPAVNELLERADTDSMVEKISYTVDERIVERASEMDDASRTFLNLDKGLPELEFFFAPNFSIPAVHQAIRHDTVEMSPESIYDAAKRGEVVVPKTIRGTRFEEDYKSVAKEAIGLYHEKKDDYGKSEAVEILPHALGMGLAISPDNDNLLGNFMNQRTKEDAQWEIREVAQEILDQASVESGFDLERLLE